MEEKGVEKCVEQFDKELNPFICSNKTRQQGTVCLGLYEGSFYSDLNTTRPGGDAYALAVRPMNQLSTHIQSSLKHNIVLNHNTKTTG